MKRYEFSTSIRFRYILTGTKIQGNIFSIILNSVYHREFGVAYNGFLTGYCYKELFGYLNEEL